MKSGIIVLVIFAALMLFALTGLEPFGQWGERDVARHYLENSLNDTGSANSVNAIMWDYRGYDTLGEETVLFTAALGVFLIMRRKGYGYHREEHK